MPRAGRVLLLLACLIQLAVHIQAQSGAGVKSAKVSTARYPGHGHHEDSYGHHDDSYGSHKDSYGHHDSYGSHEDSYDSYSQYKSGKGHYKEDSYEDDGYGHKEDSYGCDNGCPRSQPADSVIDGECDMSAGTVIDKHTSTAFPSAEHT